MATSRRSRPKTISTEKTSLWWYRSFTGRGSARHQPPTTQIREATDHTDNTEREFSRGERPRIYADLRGLFLRDSVWSVWSVASQFSGLRRVHSVVCGCVSELHAKAEGKPCVVPQLHWPRKCKTSATDHTDKRKPLTTLTTQNGNSAVENGRGSTRIIPKRFCVVCGFSIQW